jgi:AcrR family transcriptional regulator
MNEQPDTQRRDPRSRGDETRSAVLASGRLLFAQKGFDGASVRDITSGAGVNLGAVTYHFGSKRGLYGAVLRAVLTPLVDRVGAVASAEGTSLDRLARVIDVFFDHLAANPDMPRLMLQEITAGKTPPPEVLAIVRRNAGHVVRILEGGRADGTIRVAHPFLSALSVVSQPIFLAIAAPMIRELGGIDLTDPSARDAVADHVKAFVRAGLTAPDEVTP